MAELRIELNLVKGDVSIDACADTNIGAVAQLANEILERAGERRHAAQAKKRRIDDVRRQNEQATIHIRTQSSSYEYRVFRGARLQDTVVHFATRTGKDPESLAAVFEGKLVGEDTTMADVSVRDLAASTCSHINYQ